jgi:hypothetical protein
MSLCMQKTDWFGCSTYVADKNSKALFTELMNEFSVPSYFRCIPYFTCTQTIIMPCPLTWYCKKWETFAVD